MSQPRISKLDTWRDHEERVIEAILLGLSFLRSDDGAKRLKDELNLPDKRKPEDKISTVLEWYFNKATRQLWYKKRNGKRCGPLTFPKSQIPKASNPYDRSLASIDRERKKPDFKWGFVDHTCEDELKGDRDFDIECKRLGKPTSSSWKLNKQYVQDGIRRFITNEQRYGEDESSGAMIGYIENMELDDILNDVNAAINATSEPIPPFSTPAEGWQEHATSRLDHELERPFPVSPFHLWHFWIDLRDCYSG
jgi:hypothetical protein